MSNDQIKLTQKSAVALAYAIARITKESNGDTVAVRAVIQSIAAILPDNVSATMFRKIARNGVLDFSGRNYIAKVSA